MSVSVVVNVRLFPYGNPRSVGEPLGLYAGTSEVVGDASGGFVSIKFEPLNPTTNPTDDDQRRQYLFFVDGVSMQSNTTGNFTCRLLMHMALANIALGPPFTHKRTRAPLADGTGLFLPDGPLIDERMTRTPIFWDTQQLAGIVNQIVQLTAENNVLAASYRFEVYGRYYRREVLSNRAFGRLVSPVAISQFEG